MSAPRAQVTKNNCIRHVLEDVRPQALKLGAVASLVSAKLMFHCELTSPVSPYLNNCSIAALPERNDNLDLLWTPSWHLLC